MAVVVMAPSKDIDLWGLRLLRRADLHIPIDEATVSLCLDPLFVPARLYEHPAREGPVTEAEQAEIEEYGAFAESFYVAVLRTAAIYTLDAEAVRDAVEPLLRSLDEAEWALGLELPPLPFKRVLIEARESDSPGFFWGGTDEYGAWGVPAIAIVESEQGRVWEICPLVESYGNAQESWLRITATTEGLRITEGIVATWWSHDERGESEDEIPYWRNQMIAFAVTLANIITADRVPRLSVPLPRAQRRGLRQLRLLQPPRVYFVDLADAGEREPGASDREYHVRWLVRGHWRRSDSGTYVAAKRALCVWVKAYVKGPVNAPWKGRPVHRG